MSVKMNKYMRKNRTKKVTKLLLSPSMSATSAFLLEAFLVLKRHSSVFRSAENLVVPGSHATAAAAGAGAGCHEPRRRRLAAVPRASVAAAGAELLWPYLDGLSRWRSWRPRGEVKDSPPVLRLVLGVPA